MRGNNSRKSEINGQNAKIIFSFVLVIFLLSNTSAAIFINDNFNHKYNVGENVALSFSIKNDIAMEGFVNTYLECDEDEVLIDKRYIFSNNEKKNIGLEFPLKEVGDCKFKIEYLDEKTYSDEFEISDNIEILYNLNNKYFLPGENLSIFGTLKKFNNDVFNGVVDFEIGNLVEKSFDVKDGKFNFTYNIPENAKAGEYNLFLDVEEKNVEGEILNFGRINENIFVQSKATSISSDVLDNLKPAENVSFTMNVLDQSGEHMENKTILVKIFDSENSLKFQEEFLSGEKFYYYFDSNFPKGSAYIYAYYGDIVFSRPVYIRENKEIKMKLVGDGIEFINIGNAPYIGVVKISSNNESNEIKNFINVSIPVGEVFFYKLKYNGNYSITSGDFSSFISFTGAAIFDDKKNVNYFGLFILFSFIGLLIFGYFYSRRKNGKRDKRIKKLYERKGWVNSANSNWSKRRQKKIKRIEDLDKENISMEPIRVREKKLIVKELSSPNKEIRKKVFMLFVRSQRDISEYESIVSNYKYRFNKVEKNLGYVIFYQSTELSPEYKLFNLSKALLKFGEVKGDNLSIVVNRGFFEKKLSILKKFALFNKTILDMFPGKLVMSDKIMSKIHIKSSRVEKIINIMGRKIRVWVL